MTEIFFDGTLTDWKRVARRALVANLSPESLRWLSASDAQAEFPLALPSEPERPPGEHGLRVPRAFIQLANEVSCHRDERRWFLLYRALWRLTHGEPNLLDVAVDADTNELERMAKAVARDLHKMRAFVRFRKVTTENGAWFVAWFEPQHHIVEANAPFFVERFAPMQWSILTPDRCAHWDGRELTFSEGVTRDHAPSEDPLEGLWRTYYSSIFNPARVSVRAMETQMARRYWKNLPEADVIPLLLEEAPQRVESMMIASAAQKSDPSDFRTAVVPPTNRLEELREAAQHCRACPLWKTASCVVFGEGPPRARVMIVGEQPGDHEDRTGRPFVGPAGQLLDRAFAAAGVSRTDLYVTNAVKHFKWEPRGRRRLHRKPNAREIAACRPWLEAELRSVQPELIVCLGATAAQAVLGQAIQVTQERGRKFTTEFGVPALITVHPSSLLRLPNGADMEAAMAEFIDDLRQIAKTLAA